MVVCFVIAFCFYKFVLGNPENFQGGDPANQPIQGNLLGTMYKGGFMVPIILTCLLTDFALIIERYFALRTAFGKTSLVKFVAGIKAALAAKDLEKAQKLCDQQRGSVANVVSATLRKYKEMEADTVLTKEQKVLAIQKELEESTALEMPMLQQNLPILATLTTLGTLFGLFGTVMGMIRSFASLAGEGGTDSAMLSVGISEALVNTASGIATAAFALMGYNYYTNKIDKLTFSLDEVGFTIVQTFSATH
ncbi:MAG: MotA/TolQ/ExbB proton channel family protein [Prevotellaceae bacterium]|nr:MotA/TolQ/ExbB proton channel family protein [Prevotellaceae bacterium]MDD7376520.1 MotA/TolQ/ExbB proton channel family protein [Prevotellaceae bacterium]MDY4760179.1 MotA/TolQ/ExbB proton channel family protein [Bacteroidaceae bacterium]